MSIQRYSVNQHPIQTLLTWINSGEIAIPEIQRPFVWSATKVRDLIDSLYEGYPIGYLIAWRNPIIKLKDGTSSDGKRILIDGQLHIPVVTSNIMKKKYLSFVLDMFFDWFSLLLFFSSISTSFRILILFEIGVLNDSNCYNPYTTKSA